MSIVDSNARWEDEDKAMQAYLDEQDALAEAMYDDQEQIRLAEEQDEAAWQQFLAEERAAAEEQYREYLISQLEDAGAIVRRTPSVIYLTLTYDQAITREHAVSMSAQELGELEADLWRVWRSLQTDGAGYVWHVRWKVTR